MIISKTLNDMEYVSIPQAVGTVATILELWQKALLSALLQQKLPTNIDRVIHLFQYRKR